VSIQAERSQQTPNRCANVWIVINDQDGGVCVRHRSYSRLKDLDPGVLRPAHDLPTRITRLVARDEVVKQLTGQLRQHGFITIAGPDAIGKSSLPRAIAASL
jgi:hypothetical protein